LFTYVVVFVTLSGMSTTSGRDEGPVTQRAVLGGGCFWCVEAAYKGLPGVKSVASGYAGGDLPNPTYEQVCTGSTGHAEVVQIEFDPGTISYEKILQHFWKVHDPTTLNRQGPDVGSQYRSIILVADEAQRRAAEASLKEASKSFNRKIVTQIVPLRDFYRAEDYHQDYYKKNPYAGYCTFVIRPKLKKLGIA
jgi:peptide-methionine (S)-S-oxide reductase